MSLTEFTFEFVEKIAMSNLFQFFVVVGFWITLVILPILIVRNFVNMFRNKRDAKEMTGEQK